MIKFIETDNVICHICALILDDHRYDKNQDKDYDQLLGRSLSILTASFVTYQLRLGKREPGESAVYQIRTIDIKETLLDTCGDRGDVNKLLKKTCNTFFVCLDVSNQLSNFHADI